MQTKLTLRLDRRLIRQAKTYAARTGKSVSGIVADFFGRLEDPHAPVETELAPLVESLVGALRGRRVTEADYRRYLEAKHR